MTTVQRIHIMGGQGTGKTTLAQRIGERTGLPVHRLDDVARIGGGNGPERATPARDAMVAAIAATDRWVTEGVHLGWTQPLVDRADVVVWLDHVSGGRASGRMLRRFIRDAWVEMRARRGRDRFLRLGDYTRHARDLVVAVWHRGDTRDTDIYAAALADHPGRVVRCCSDADIEAFLSTLDRPIVEERAA